MKVYGSKAQETINALINSFKAGDIPRALSQVFIHRDDERPCNSWSRCNQLLVFLNGHCDGRGYKQWQQVNRTVKKGEKAFYILIPLIKKEEETEGEEKSRLYGFKCSPVFGYSQTEGEDLPGLSEDNRAFINALPLVDVAKQWGINIDLMNGGNSPYLGYFQPGKQGGQSQIVLATKNLSTWAHELMHAADRRSDKTRTKVLWFDEVLAELGGCTLLEMLGYPQEADKGGCWEYVNRYAKEAKIEPLTACQRVLNRVCECIDLILQEASQEQTKAA